VNYRPKALNIAAIRQASETARGEICKKCTGGMVRPPEDPQAYAWGQYLEIRGKSVQQSLWKQYGIYGTSAAVQILTMQSKGSYRNLILRGSRVLPLVQKDPDPSYNGLHEKFIKKGDLSTVYKLCSLLDAATVLEPLSDSKDFDIDRAKILREVLTIRHLDAGWPDYKSDDNDWQGPNTHATAVALFAISKGAVSVEAQEACHQALRWFCDQSLEKQSVATLSMLAMAYANFAKETGPNSEFHESRLNSLHIRCENLIYEWVRGSFPGEVQRSLEGIEYWLPPAPERPRTAGGANYTVLLYLPHVLAALAVLAVPRLRSRYICRQYVLGVVERVTRELNSQGCFIAAGRNMVSTVEHLWLYRLLHEFEIQSLYPSRWLVFLDHLRYHVTRRWPITAFIGMLTVALGVAAVLTSGVVQAALSAVSAVALAVLATIVATLLVGRWSET
jgi:hypothetical protein